MILNATYYSLILSATLSPSPLFSLVLPSIFSIKKSQFSKIFHPILLKKTPVHFISFEEILGKKLFSNFLCESLPESPDGSSKTGCITNTQTNFILTNDDSYDLLNAYISLVSCTFIDCTTRQMIPLFMIQNSCVKMKYLTVINSKYTFGQIGSPYNNSQVQFSIFENCYNPFTITNGDFSFESSTFDCNEDENNNNINLLICTTVSFINCTFYMKGQIFAISAEQTPNIRVSECNFYEDSKIELKDGSYLMLVSTCFEKSEDDSIINREYSVKTNVSFSFNCNFVPTNISVEEDKTAYAIATMAVFIVCFAILFIVLSVLFFCKVGRNEITQFGHLHERSQGEDEVSSVELDD